MNKKVFLMSLASLCVLASCGGSKKSTSQIISEKESEVTSENEISSEKENISSEEISSLLSSISEGPIVYNETYNITIWKSNGYYSYDKGLTASFSSSGSESTNASKSTYSFSYYITLGNALKQAQSLSLKSIKIKNSVSNEEFDISSSAYLSGKDSETGLSAMGENKNLTITLRGSIYDTNISSDSYYIINASLYDEISHNTYNITGYRCIKMYTYETKEEKVYLNAPVNLENGLSFYFDDEASVTLDSFNYPVVNGKLYMKNNSTNDINLYAVNNGYFHLEAKEEDYCGGIYSLYDNDNSTLYLSDNEKYTFKSNATIYTLVNDSNIYETDTGNISLTVNYYDKTNEVHYKVIYCFWNQEA